MKTAVWYVVDLQLKRIVNVHLSIDSRTPMDVLRIVCKLRFNVEYYATEDLGTGRWNRLKLSINT